MAPFNQPQLGLFGSLCRTPSLGFLLGPRPPPPAVPPPRRPRHRPRRCNRLGLTRADVPHTCSYSTLPPPIMTIRAFPRGASTERLPCCTFTTFSLSHSFSARRIGTCFISSGFLFSRRVYAHDHGRERGRAGKRKTFGSWRREAFLPGSTPYALYACMIGYCVGLRDPGARTGKGGGEMDGV